jgi:hypothetical protein
MDCGNIVLNYDKAISKEYGKGVAKLCHKVLYYCDLNKKKGREAKVYLSARKLAVCLDKSRASIERYFAAARKAELITTEKYYRDGFLVGNLVTPTEKLLALRCTQNDGISPSKSYNRSIKMIDSNHQNDGDNIYKNHIYTITPTMPDGSAPQPTVADATGVGDVQNEMMKANEDLAELRKMIENQNKLIKLLIDKLSTYEKVELPVTESESSRGTDIMETIEIQSKKTIPHSPPPTQALKKNKQSKLKEAQLLEEKKFDEWYQLYPRKVSKKKAREAFGKALKKIPCEDLMALTKAYMNANETQETLKRENGKFIPHPTTWLNQERWEDYQESFQKRSSMTLAQVTTAATSEEDRKILESLYKRVGANTFASWFTYNDFHFLGLDHTPAGEVAIFEVKSPFSRDWIRNNFKQDIASSVKDVYGDALSIEVVLKGQRKLNPWKTEHNTPNLPHLPHGFPFVPQMRGI